MNEILRKATEELSLEKPNIAYVRGMLETLLELNGGMDVTNQTRPFVPPISIKSTEVTNDEGSILDAQTRALMGKIPPPTE